MTLGKLIKRLPEKPRAKLFTETFLRAHVIIYLHLSKFDYYSKKELLYFWSKWNIYLHNE